MFLDSFHTPPDGYHYEFEEFNSKYIRILLHHHFKYTYKNGNSTSTVWGFYNTKTKKFYSPVNSKTVGKVVDFENTRNYTAMPIKQTPLEAAFV